MKELCDCGTPFDTIKGNGYTFVACPKGHYERHEATGDKLRDSDWSKEILGRELAPYPEAISQAIEDAYAATHAPEPVVPPRPGTSIASALAHDALLWAEQELVKLEREFPEMNLRLPSWIDGQTELQKLTASSGVLEIKDAIEKYKQRVNAYLGKWRKKLQSQSGKS